MSSVHAKNDSANAVLSSFIHSLSSNQATALYQPTSAEFVYRKYLRQSMAAICKHIGFDFIETDIMELMVHILNSYLLEVGAMTRAYTEHANRTISTPTDALLALVELGIAIDSLHGFLKESKIHGPNAIAPPRFSTAPSGVPALHVGKARSHPSHIPDYLPPFPDPHTYIKTEISGDPELTYERVRDDCAQLKRNTEVSLKDFMLKTRPSITLLSKYEDCCRQEARKLISECMRKQNTEYVNEQTDLTNGISTEEMAIDYANYELTVYDNEQAIDNAPTSFAMDEMFAMKETERSLVQNKVPTFCQVLEPTTNNRPYLSDLCTDLVDELLLSASGAIQPLSSSYDQTITLDDSSTSDVNPYLRTPKLPMAVDDYAE